MSNFSTSHTTYRKFYVPLRGRSHEVCVAVTQAEYWQHLTQNSSISITSTGNYVPRELDSLCNNDEEPKLQLIVESLSEHDQGKFEFIYGKIQSDLTVFNLWDRPIHDFNNQEVVLYGSLFNSLPIHIFDSERQIFGEGNCNINKIKDAFGCSIVFDRNCTSNRFRFKIKHEKATIRYIVAVQIQELVRQAQSVYVMKYATKIGRTALDFTKPLKPNPSTRNSVDCRLYLPFQSPCKRKHNEDKEEENDAWLFDSDQSDNDHDDAANSNGKRKLHRHEVELLFDRICKRMQDRAPRDDVEKAGENRAEIMCYFHDNKPSETSLRQSPLKIEIVEQLFDLRARNINAHKATLVFNRVLKIGGVRGKSKRRAIARAYTILKTLTRDTPRENILIRKTRDGRWKAVIKSMDNK